MGGLDSSCYFLHPKHETPVVLGYFQVKVVYEIESWKEEEKGELKAASSQVHVAPGMCMQVRSFKACMCLKVYQICTVGLEDGEEGEGVEPFQCFIPSWKKFSSKFYALYSHWINETNEEQVPQGKKYSLKALVEKVHAFLRIILSLEIPLFSLKDYEVKS